MTELPVISVIVLNYNGKQHLETCLSSLMAVHYPEGCREFILVDNASGDGSVELVRERFPEVQVLQNATNLGFASANNRGARAARGEFVVFLNNDTRVDPDFLTHLVQPCLDEPGVACTAAKILDWEGRHIDFASSAMNYHAFAFQPSFGAEDTFHTVKPLLFACGGAMLIRREVFLDSGGFDDDYFIYFEDLDLGWRLWLMGYRVLFVPDAIVYHRLHATMDAFADYRKWVLFERNALMTLIKNYDDESLRSALPAALLLMFKRAERLAQAYGWRKEPYNITDRTSAGPADAMPRAAVAALVAANEVTDNLAHVFAKRAHVQARRRRTDAEIIRMFGEPMRVHTILHPVLDEAYSRAHYDVAHWLGLGDLFASLPRRVLVISSDLLPFEGLPTTGAGLRAWSLGQGLAARGHDVLFSMPRAAHTAGPQGDSAPCLLWDPGRLDDVVALAHPDVIVACGWSTLTHLAHSTVPVVLDQHGPHLLERQFQKHLDTETNAAEKIGGLAKADLFTCAGTRQRDYFLPWLSKAGYDDPERQSAVIPVSLGGDWPCSAPAAGEITFVYGGVFLPWQDPSLALITLVERMEALGHGRLCIYGGRHPFIPIDTREFDRLTALLQQSRRVEVSPMLPRAELLDRYRCAHVAVDLMRRNPERELAFTTRTVEYLWCGLPVVYNNYAELSDYIGPAGTGWCLDPEDRAAMAEVYDSILLHPEKLAARSAAARCLAEERLNWVHNIETLDHFCRHPYRRAARAYVPPSSVPAGQPLPLPPRGLPAKSFRSLLGEAQFHYRRGGLRTLASESLGFAQRKLRRP